MNAWFDYDDRDDLAEMRYGGTSPATARRVIRYTVDAGNLVRRLEQVGGTTFASGIASLGGVTLVGPVLGGGAAVASLVGMDQDGPGVERRADPWDDLFLSGQISYEQYKAHLDEKWRGDAAVFGALVVIGGAVLTDGIELSDEQLSVDKFPWQDTRLVIAAVRSANGIGSHERIPSPLGSPEAHSESLNSGG